MLLNSLLSSYYLLFFQKVIIMADSNTSCNENKSDNENENEEKSTGSNEDPLSNFNTRRLPARKRKAKTFGIDDLISIPVKKQQPAASASATTKQASDEVTGLTVKFSTTLSMMIHQFIFI